MGEKTQLVECASYYRAAKATWEVKALIEAMLLHYDNDGDIPETLREMVKSRLETATYELGHPDIAGIPF